MYDVKYSPALRWFILLMFPLTLGWKLAAGEEPAPKVTAMLVEFLTRHQFSVEVTDRMSWNDLPLIRATAGVCRMAIAEASADGWDREIFRRVARNTDQVFFVYRGVISTRQPNSLSVTRRWWSRYLRKLGLASLEIPAIAVAASTSCHAERLPWAELHT